MKYFGYIRTMNPRIQTARLVAAMLAITAPAMGQTTPALTVVSAASLSRDAALSPEMIVSGFTPALGDISASAPSASPPMALAGYSVMVRDSAGVERPAPIIAIGGRQISFLIPAGTATGAATITLRTEGRTVASGTARIAAVSPGVFTANSSGEGAPAGVALFTDPSGRQATQNLFEMGRSGVLLPNPIDLTDSRQVSLVLFGTGIRGMRTGVTATLGGERVPVAFAGAQANFPGLDQINIVPLPRALTDRRGETDLVLSVDGATSNRVSIAATAPGFASWGRRGTLVEANSEMGVAELDGKIYVIGGYPSSRVTVAAVQVYDPVTDEWQLTAPLPVPLNHLMPATANGKLYVIGGQTDSGGGPNNFVNTVYEYDPATRQWRSRTPMPTARGGGAAAVLDGKIYVAGSRPPRGADFAVYDPAQDRWTTLPDIPTQRNHLGVAAANGKIYVIGGRFAAGFNSEITAIVEAFDPNTNTWSRVADLPEPRGGLNALEAMGCIHTFGGEGTNQHPNGVFPFHEIYDPISNVWIRVDNMPVPVHGVTGAAFVSGLIYLPGGGTMEGGSSGGRQHQVYRPDVVCK